MFYNNIRRSYRLLYYDY